VRGREYTVDGTSDRPPGKIAENWGRKDRIRAGSVSGPWRSMPREPAEPPARPAEGRTPAPQPAAGTPRRPADLRPRRALGTVAWVSIGVAVALGCVLAAFLLRPPADVAPPRVATDEAATPSGATDEAAAAPAPAAPAADPALARITGVRLRTGPDFPADRRDAIVAALGAAGIEPVGIETLDIEVTATRVGYYRDADLPAAEALARMIAPVLAIDGPLAVRDYGQLLADPEPGRLDLWVGG
jgi:hypothetical protein